MGVGPRLVRWISEFLRNRAFKVKVGTELSAPVMATTGCPQGTVLGSLMFLFFIDGVKSIIPEGVRYKIYADDLNIYMPVDSDEERAKLQSVLNDFYVWSTKMRLKLSIHKCNVLHMGTKNSMFTYTLGSVSLVAKPIVKDLGVFMSNCFDFESHTTEVLQKTSPISNWILRTFALTRSFPYIRLYRAIALPVLLYGCQVWNPRLKKNKERLERMQNRFLRRVEYRCCLERHVLELESLQSQMTTMDLRLLIGLANDEERLTALFNIRDTGSRSGVVVEAKAIARTEKIASLYPWRVVRTLNNG